MFLCAWFIGVVASFVLWRCLEWLKSRAQDPRRRRLYLFPAWAVALLILLFGPEMLLYVSYPLVHPNSMVCTYIVWPAFLFQPILLGFLPLGQWVWRKRNAKREKAHG
jgi:hypothetical protein